MAPGYVGPLDDRLDRYSKNKHSALSGDDNLGDLPGEDTEADFKLHQSIMEHLKKHVEVDTGQIRVSVKDGFVSLTGHVDSERARATIRGLVESVDGVEDVVSFIELSEK